MKTTAQVLTAAAPTVHVCACAGDGRNQHISGPGHGLRAAVLASALLQALGTLVRCIPTSTPNMFWSMNAGQVLNGLAGPIVMAAPPQISQNWFAPEQRTTVRPHAAPPPARLPPTARGVSWQRARRLLLSGTHDSYYYSTRIVDAAAAAGVAPRGRLLP